MTVERVVKVRNGWVMLVVDLLALVLGVGLIVWGAVMLASAATSETGSAAAGGWVLGSGVVVVVVAGILMAGFFSLQPNEARVLVLFGRYVGTVRAAGFHWGNPFYSNAEAGAPQQQEETKEKGQKAKWPSRFKVSLRARTLLGDKLKVNDQRGNPVEIAAMVVWRVHDTAQAVFDVESFPTYVVTQAETALRHVATAYPYDQGDDPEADLVTLRGNPDEVSAALRQDLAARLAVAGVVVEDARLTHLAYAPEIAQAMLRRQQAEAVIAARRKIVTGAVSMVEMALGELTQAHVVDLDDERKAAMVSNLMVVLCGESDVTPVLNTGTLYT
ncbi:MAG: SPFH domain-containing protein [Candidatus Nanopelagicales bacterium]